MVKQSLIIDILLIIIVFIILTILSKLILRCFYSVLNKILLKGVEDMEVTYFHLVMLGRYTCNPENKKTKQVMARFKPLVIELLEESELDLDGNPIVLEK